MGSPADEPLAVRVMSSASAGPLGIGVKQLIKVAHAIEQEFIRVLGLDTQVLAHHRRMLIGWCGVGRVGGQRESL